MIKIDFLAPVELFPIGSMAYRLRRCTRRAWRAKRRAQRLRRRPKSRRCSARQPQTRQESIDF